MVQQLQHTLHVVEGLLVSFQVACKSSRTYLSPLAVNMAIQTTSDDTTISPNARPQILTAFLISTDSHLSSSLKRLCTSVALLSNQDTLVLDPTNLSNMELMCLLIATPGRQLSQSRAWSLGSQ